MPILGHPDKGFETREQLRAGIVSDALGVSLGWTGAGHRPYFIPWSELKKPEHLLRWCHHLSIKFWFTPGRMQIFIEDVCARKGWKLFQRPKRKRDQMNARLRFEILTRDSFSCVACGRGPADGVKLHIDHRRPYAAGGTDDPDNLRTLCADCNVGKGAA
jgi:hypothetical protein